MSSRPYKQQQQRAYAAQYRSYNIIDDILSIFQPQQAEATGTVGPGGISTLGKMGLTDVLGKGFGEAIRQGQGGTTTLADPEDALGKAIFAILDWINKDNKAAWVEGVKKFLRSPQTVFPQDAYAQAGTNFSTPCKACRTGYVSRRTVLGGCYCIQVSSAGSRFPAKSGTSGNCNWDTKGGWCWNGIACGGNCKICRTGYVTSNTSTGCNAVRTYFLDNYRKCKSCASQSGATVTPKTTTGCPYSGCTDLSAGSTCFHCRCAKLCSGKGGIRTVKSDGSCYCNGASSNIPTTTAKPVDKLTSGCSYSGCNSSTGMTRCYCRCQKLCASKGGVKTVTSNGSCYCKGVPKTTSTSGGCSDSLKTRCGFFCASRPGNPYLDSKCSCFCR